MNNNMEQKVIAGKSISRITKSTILIIAMIISIPLLIMFFTCFRNPSTPAGYEGYIKRGAIIGKTNYYGKQTGPTSTGLSWLLKVQNIDFRWQTYSENFMVMSADNLELSFNAHIVMRAKPEQKGFEIDIAKKDTEIKIIEAEGIAATQKIINSTLTSQYLQHEAIKAQMDMANSPNHSTVYIPSGANGIPLIKMLE